MKLTDLKVRSAKPRDVRYTMADGRGLTLLVEPTGAKLWRFRYRYRGKPSTLGFGAYPIVTLSEAREKTIDMQRLLAAGENPSEHHNRRKRPKPVSADFGELVQTFLDNYWKAKDSADNTKRKDQRLQRYLAAEVKRPVLELDAPYLAGVFRKLTEANGYQTASYALALARKVLDEQVQLGKLTSNPAASVRLDTSKKGKTEQRAAITDPAKLPVLFSDIKQRGEVSPLVRLGLQLLALTVPRPNELLQAQWSEFALDDEAPMWRIPAERMKLRREHLVPLSKQAVELLRVMRALSVGDYVFSEDGKHTLAANSFRDALQRLGYSGVHSAHGFRSTFSTLLHEQGFNSDAIEVALAHKIPGVRGVYNRAHLLKERTAMLQHWADYLESLKPS